MGTMHRVWHFTSDELWQHTEPQAGQQGASLHCQPSSAVSVALPIGKAGTQILGKAGQL